MAVVGGTYWYKFYHSEMLVWREVSIGWFQAEVGRRLKEK